MAIDVGDETLDTAFSLFSPVSALTRRFDQISLAGQITRPTTGQTVRHTVGQDEPFNASHDLRPVVTLAPLDPTTVSVDVRREQVDGRVSSVSPISPNMVGGVEFIDARIPTKSKTAKNARPARTRMITQAINQTVNAMNASNIRNNIKPIVKNGTIKKSVPLAEKQTKNNNIYMNESDNEYSIGCIGFDSSSGKASKSKTVNNTSDKTCNKNARKNADKIVDKTSDKRNDKTSDKTSDKMSDKNISKISVKTTDTTTDKNTDKTTDKTTEKSTDKIADKMSGCGTPSSGGNWSTKWFGGLLRTRPKMRPVRGRARRNESHRPPVVAPALNAFPSGHRFGRLVESTSADMFPLTNALSFASLSPLSSSLSREIPRTSSVRRSRSIYSHSNGRNDKLWAISLKCRQWLRAENHRYQQERQRRSRGNSPYPAMTKPSAPIPFGAFCYQTKAPIRFIIGHMDITLSTPSPVRFSFITEELFIQRQLEARTRENQSNRFLIHHGKIFRSPFFLTDMERLAVAPNHRKYT